VASYDKGLSGGLLYISLDIPPTYETLSYV